MTNKICKPKMMDCLTCKRNTNLKESFCYVEEKCSVPRAMVKDGKEIIAWEI